MAVAMPRWVSRSAVCRVSAISGWRAASASRSGMICEATGCRSARAVTSSSIRMSPSRLPVAGAGIPTAATAETTSRTSGSLERQRR